MVNEAMFLAGRFMVGCGYVYNPTFVYLLY